MIEIPRDDIASSLGRKFINNDVYTPENPLYPHVRVSFTNHDGNIFALMGTVTSAMRGAHRNSDGSLDDEYERITSEEIGEIVKKIMMESTSYDHALALLSSYVTVVEFHDEDL